MQSTIDWLVRAPFLHAQACVLALAHTTPMAAMFAVVPATTPVLARSAPGPSRVVNIRASIPSSVRLGQHGRGRVGLTTRVATPRRAVHCCASGVDLRSLIERLCLGEDLSEQEAQASMDALLDAEPEQIAAFLVLLRAKGETGAEMAGLARAMKARGVPVLAGDDVLDIVGTGGDDAGTVNISTGSCILAAAAGAKVAKHGNRSVSSLCGSADVLEALGVAIDLGPEGVAQCVKEVGMGFMYAPRYHPSMKAVAPVRKKLKVRTAFNLLGPMLNPASSKYALVGVYTPELMPLMADSLMKLGMKKALVVCSTVGNLSLDEMTPCGPTSVMEVTPGGIKTYSFDPKDVGIPFCELSDLAGGDAKLNAQMLMDALGGEKGPVANCLMLNAGVAMAAADQAESVAEGVAMCKEAHAKGLGGETLTKWVALSQKLRAEEEE